MRKSKNRLALLTNSQIDERISKMIAQKKELSYYNKAQNKLLAEINMLSITNRAFHQYQNKNRPKTRYSDRTYTTLKTFSAKIRDNYPDPLGLKQRNTTGSVNNEEANAALTRCLNQFQAKTDCKALRPAVLKLHQNVIKSGDYEPEPLTRHKSNLEESYRQKDAAFAKIPKFSNINLGEWMKKDVSSLRKSVKIQPNIESDQSGRQ